MKRSTIPYTGLLLLFFGWAPASGTLAAGPDAQPAAPPRPNVLMIVVDDMNDWVGCLGGHPDVQTPNIDRLARRGMLLSNAHCAAPVCNPSRVATLSGRRPGSTGIYDNSVRWHEALPELVTIPQHFKQHGYHVMGGGKTFHHMPGFLRRSDWHAYFDQVFDCPSQTWIAQGGETKDFRWPEGFPVNDLPAVKAFSRPPTNPYEFDWGAFDQADHEMGDGQMVQWATALLAHPPQEPFFLAAGIFRPHMPFYAPRKYFDMYPADQITLPPVKPDDLDDLPEAGRQMASTRRGDLELLYATDQYRPLLQAYLASITYCDALVGRLLDALDAGPAADNTIVVLWSDHGWHLGEKRHLHKFTLWERSTHVPLIIAAPGVTRPNSRTTRPAGLIDLFPTLNELCRLPAVPQLDGRSLVPLLTDPEAAWDWPALTTHGAGNHAVRTERWRYIRYADGSEELYDHASDPHEWTNLAGDPELSDRKTELRRFIPESDAASLKARKNGAR